MDCRVIRAFTPVFDGLCPAMTAEIAVAANKGRQAELFRPL
jgi:hypothetical protein